jgi:hypothetical protein
MKIIILVCIIGLMVFSAGCTTYFSNLASPKYNLQLNQSAVFEKEGNQFSARIDGIKGIRAGSRVSQVDITIHVTGGGSKPVSLMAYPSISDNAGNIYYGKSIFLGMISPGGQVTEKSSVLIPSEEAYDSLKKGAMVNLRFQDTKLIPYEGTWDIDIEKI